MDHDAELRRQNRALAAVCAEADADLGLPSCPGWTVRQLLTHVGRGDRWAATIVRERRQVALAMRDVADGKPPAEPDAALAWLRDGADQLIDAVAPDPDVEVWTFVGPRPARWWVRRRQQENLIHRIDVALASGAAPTVEHDVAADCLSELIELFQAFGDRPLPDGTTLRLTASDTGATWLLAGTPDGFTVGSDSGPADAVVEAPMTVLLLATYRRLAVDDSRLAVAGTADVWRQWYEAVEF